MIDQLNNTTWLSFDNLGQKTAMTDPDMGTWWYGYNDGGNLTRQTDANDQRGNQADL